MVELSDIAIAHAIQLAVAPVFLLTGIGAILAVMTNRLGRIIDRARVLEANLESAFAQARHNVPHRPRDTFTPRKTDQPGDHAVHYDSASHMHGYSGVIPQRILTI